MGYCIDGDHQIDVFFSYARADDEVHNHWVSDFERYLTTTVRAQLKRQPGADGQRAEQFRVCRDETGFPTGGQLEEIVYERVRHSQYLFVFLGSGYLNSSWCLSELEAFRHSADGTVSGTLKRLFLIVLDREALDRLREGREPAALPRERHRLWTDIAGITQAALRIEGFLDESGDGLVPVYQEVNRAHPAFHKACRRVVDDLVQRLVQRRAKTPATAPMPIEQPPHNIVIGAVPERLASAQEALLQALGRHHVRVITAAEASDAAAMLRAIAGAGLVLQPFDRGYPIGWSPYAPGGHLAFQQNLFREAQQHGQLSLDARFIWWEPPNIDAPAKPMPTEHASFLAEIDALPEVERRRSSAADLAKELATGATPLTTARVWVEWEQSDSETIEQATKIVRHYFDAYCAKQAKQGIQMNAALKFGKVDWETLQHGLKDTAAKKKPLGVIIVYSEHKDWDALNEQGDCISDLEDVLLKRMFPGIFVIRPDRFFLPNDDWGYVRFNRSQRTLTYDPAELEKFVGELFNVLSKNCVAQSSEAAR